MKTMVACLAVSALAGMTVPATAAVRVVADGASDFTIVRPEPATPSLVYAAEELQRLTQEITGATLPIQTDAEALPEKAFVLGVTRHTADVLGQPVDLAALGDDGFHLKTVGSRVVIAGSDVRGTLYGVYELLETYGGCRWYSSWHSVIPQRETWILPDIDDTQVPAFVMREPFWFDMFDGDFAARCRANGNRMQLEEKHGGKIRFGAGLFVHTFYRLMPPGEFFDEHPDYYSELNGKRVADHAQLCLTNPDVLRIITERLLDRIRSDPDAKLYSLSQNDWRGYCTCDDCRAIDEREGSPAGTMITFVNKVAEEVEKEFPDAWIETLAYQYTRTPPKTVRPRHNVVPRLCTIECEFSQPLDVSPFEQNRTFVDDIRGWSAITDKLYIWDYTTNFGHYVGPHPNFNCLQGNVKFFRDNSVVGLFEQGAYQGRHAEFAELRAWVLAKLLWNPEADLEGLYQEFFTGYYGAAAPLVRQYFDDLQKLTEPDDVHLRIWNPPTASYYPDGFFEAALGLWRQAERLVQDSPTHLYNVRMGALPVIYALLWRLDAPETSHELVGDRFVPTNTGGDYVALAKEFLSRFEEAGDIRISENMDRHRTFVNRMRAVTTGFDTIRIEGDGLVANVAPDLGGRVCRLARNGGENVLDPAFGLDVVQARSASLEPANDVYTGTPEGQRVATVSRSWRRQYGLTRKIAVTPEGLQVTATISSHRTEDQSIRPALRAALTLGNGAAACLRAGDEDWQTVSVDSDQIMAFGSLTGSDLSGKTLTVASPVTGRAVAIEANTALERLQVVCDVPKQRILVIGMAPATDLKHGAPWHGTFTIRPLGTVDGLPSIDLPETHTATRFVVEDCMIGIGRYGTWGVHVLDPEAKDGSAAKLFGTHFEWCIQWRFDPKWFEDDAVYTVRMRVKTDKRADTGEAFWAGVYDTVEKKGYGQIAPKVEESGDGYTWYDVTTWTPKPNQYIWMGPGRFDKGGGQPSAINAVYLDRIELVKQTPDQ